MTRESGRGIRARSTAERHGARWLPWAIVCGVTAIAGCGDNEVSPAPLDLSGSVADLSTTAPADLTAPAPDAARATDAAPTGTMHRVQVGPSGQFVFSPSSLTIRAGDSVTWVWNSNTHTVTSGAGCAADGKFCDQSDSACDSTTILNTGAMYTHTFPTAGTFPYFCQVHCTLGMTGTIVVQ